MRLIFLFSLLSTFSLFAQDSTTVKKPDSLQNRSIQITPYYSQDVATSGNYITTINDSALFQFSAGLSVFNVLRGRTPSLVIPSYAPGATAEIRSSFLGDFNSNTIIMDGVPVSNSIVNYQNMNAFEFSSISVVGNNNALMFLDTQGSGAILLTSKSGENVKKPTFEFNSYATQGQREVGIRGGGTKTDRDTYWSNSLAYAQDFGVMDARISYNFLTHSDANTTLPSLHNLKVNVGANLNSKIDFRLILNDQFSKGDYGNSNLSLENEQTRNSFYGNMTMHYKPLDWLHFSSQLVYSSNNSDTVSGYIIGGTNFTGVTNRKLQSNFQTGNLFANLQRSLGDFYLSGFAGIQHSKQEINRYYSRTDTTVYEYNEDRFFTSPVVSTGITLTFQKLISLSAIYRHSKYEYMERTSSKIKDGTNYSIGSAFIFSELLKWNFLSLGKIRTNIGSKCEISFPNYPYRYTQIQFMSLDVSKNKEAGVDFFFYKSALGLSVSYFKREINYESAYTSIFKELHSKGWEASVLFAPIQKRQFKYQVGLIFSTFSTQSKSWYEYDPPYPYSDTDWKANFSSAVSFKNLQFNFVVERINTHFFSGNNPSFTKLRDVSLGYQLPHAMISRYGLQKASISISGRNLLMSVESGNDYEDNFNYQKSFSIGLNVVF